MFYLVYGSWLSSASIYCAAKKKKIEIKIYLSCIPVKFLKQEHLLERYNCITFQKDLCLKQEKKMLFVNVVRKIKRNSMKTSPIFCCVNILKGEMSSGKHCLGITTKQSKMPLKTLMHYINLMFLIKPMKESLPKLHKRCPQLKACLHVI